DETMQFLIQKTALQTGGNRKQRGRSGAHHPSARLFSESKTASFRPDLFQNRTDYRAAFLIVKILFPMPISA
ncbi:hypothetical protein, partial [Aeromonas veronii]|uniref:hypothetical protein n=1 Tax=Aeromonas veronii TaxID=654 RepID=UPI002B49D49B